MMSQFKIHFEVRECLKRAAGWVPWLVVALALAGLLWPATTTASRLVFQSDVPTPTQPPPPPTDTPVPPPTDTPVPPPTDEPVPPTDIPSPVPTDTPEAQTTDTLTPEPSATFTVPAPLATFTVTLPPPPTLRPTMVVVISSTTPDEGQSIVNWAKFWDTVTVVVAYPWLCCGIGLLLLVPLALLYLEIKGRRRPPTAPETVRPKSPAQGTKRR